MTEEKHRVIFDSSDIIMDGENVGACIRTDKDVLFNESYIIIGEEIRAKNIYAMYDLTVIGDISCENISVNGILLVHGDIKADCIVCGELICEGEVRSKRFETENDSYAKSMDVENLKAGNSLIVLEDALAKNSCEIGKNLLAGGGISVTGDNLIASMVISPEYIDFDGDTDSRIVDLSINNDAGGLSSNNEEAKKENDHFEVKNPVETFVENNIDKEEDWIIAKLNEYAEKEPEGFKEVSFLFQEIVRISYMEEIDNLRDYLYVTHAYIIFPKALTEYETIEHVFNNMVKDVDYRELEYHAESVEEIAYSIKIVSEDWKSDEDLMADKIFSSIGLKYCYVKTLLGGDK